MPISETALVCEQEGISYETSLVLDLLRAGGVLNTFDAEIGQHPSHHAGIQERLLRRIRGRMDDFSRQRKYGFLFSLFRFSGYPKRTVSREILPEIPPVAAVARR